MTVDDLLLVDDDPAFRAAARDLLAGAGFGRILEAATGGDALRTAAAVRPSVVLLDVQLPDIDGFEVTRRLLAEDAPPRVVLISTRDAIDYGRRIVDCGALGFITKARLSAGALRAMLRAQVEAPR
jgi:DNA-binding NarL/FixJ family response regulator